MNLGTIVLLSDGLVARYPGPEQSDDGPDYATVCTQHQWASLPVPHEAQCLRCPHCRVLLEETRGRERYVALQQAMLAQQIEQVPHE